MTKKHTAIFLIALNALPSAFAQGSKEAKKPAEPAAAQAQAPVEEGSEKVNVDKIKEKYWARGDESELGVVQNRLYSKARRFELGLLGGTITSDPFLNTKALGGSFGYHFTETFSAHVVAWKTFAHGSSANEVLEAGGKKANTNPPNGYYGAEGRASLLYGKLSLVGKSIIYYDFHLLGGAGITSTETGKYFTPHVGLGQQFFLSKSSSLNIDYRLMRYTERSYEKEITARRGQLNEARANWSHVINLGVSFFFGSGN